MTTGVQNCSLGWFTSLRKNYKFALFNFLFSRSGQKIEVKLAKIVTRGVHKKTSSIHCCQEEKKDFSTKDQKDTTGNR